MSNFLSSMHEEDYFLDLDALDNTVVHLQWDTSGS